MAPPLVAAVVAAATVQFTERVAAENNGIHGEKRERLPLSTKESVRSHTRRYTLCSRQTLNLPVPRREKEAVKRNRAGEGGPKKRARYK